MSISDFPNGFANGVTIRGLPITQAYPGKVIWVNNSSVLAPGGVGGSDSNPGTYLKPKSTIAGAITEATASRGDIVMVMPGHSETITTDGGLALSKAGVAVVGLGSGTIRPKIVLDTAAAAAITVTAANCALKNFIIEASFADITNAIDVTATWFALENCRFQDEGTNLNFLDYVVASGADNTADGLRIADCEGYTPDAGMNSPLRIVGDLKDLEFVGNRFNTDNANALAMILCATGKDLNNALIKDNLYASLKTSGDILVDNDTTANDGWAVSNRAQHLDTATEVLVDADGIGQFDNLGTGSVTASGYLLPAADS